MSKEYLPAESLLRQCPPDDKCLPNGQDSANAHQLCWTLHVVSANTCQFWWTPCGVWVGLGRVWVDLEACASGVLADIPPLCCRHRRVLPVTRRVNPQRGRAVVENFCGGVGGYNGATKRYYY